MVDCDVAACVQNGMCRTPARLCLVWRCVHGLTDCNGAKALLMEMLPPNLVSIDRHNKVHVSERAIRG